MHEGESDFGKNPVDGLVSKVRTLELDQFDIIEQEEVKRLLRKS